MFVEEQSFFLQTLLFTAFVATVQNYNIHACEHMILGHLRMGAHQMTYAPLGLATTGQSCGKEKVPFSLMNISLLANIGCYFGKNGFSARSFVIPAGTISVIKMGLFLVTRIVPTSFVKYISKLGVLI